MQVLARIIALALLVTPLTAAALPPGTIHRIGFLWNSSPAFTHQLLEAFRHGLHERGYVEGTHFTIENRYAEGDPARLPSLAAELVGLPVAVIVTSGTQATQAVKQATSTIPVVIAASNRLPYWETPSSLSCGLRYSASAATSASSSATM